MCTERRFLAVEPGFGSVTECGCGTIHLSVGPVSIALHAQSLRKLQTLISAALKEQLAPSEKDEDADGSGMGRVLTVQ